MYFKYTENKFNHSIDGKQPLRFPNVCIPGRAGGFEGPFGNENANVYWCPLLELLLSQGEGWSHSTQQALPYKYKFPKQQKQLRRSAFNTNSVINEQPFLKILQRSTNQSYNIQPTECRIIKIRRGRPSKVGKDVELFWVKISANTSKIIKLDTTFWFMAS